MQMPGMTTSAETLHGEFGLYHLTRLRAEKALKEMAEGWEQGQGRLAAKIQALESAQAAAMTAMAVRDGEDAALDDTIRRFNLGLLQKTGNSRKSPLYLTYFPEGMAPVVNAPLESEVQKVNVILSKLGQEKDEELRSFLGPISAALASLVAAMDAHQTAFDASLQAYGLVEQEKINWLDAYKLNHRTLVQKYYNEPKKPETFFKPAKTGKKVAAAPAPAPAAKG